MARYAFIHIPKNAGRSFQEMLHGSEHIDYFDHDVKREQVKNHKKIYVLRNPIERFTSAFFYIKELRIKNGNYGRDYYKTPDQLLYDLRNFDQKSLIFMKNGGDSFHSVYDKPINTNWVFHKQCDWLYDPWKVLIYENIENDLNKLNLELNTNFKLLHKNKSQKINFSYSDADIALLRILYSEDFLLYSKYSTITH